MSFYATYPIEGGSGSSGVTSLNGETGSISIVGGTGISVGTAGGTITVTNTAAGNEYYVNLFTLTPTDISNGYVTLSQAPDTAVDTVLTVIGGPMQSYGADYTVSGSQLSWNGLFLSGVLSSGDMLVVQFN